MIIESLWDMLKLEAEEIFEYKDLPAIGPFVEVNSEIYQLIYDDNLYLMRCDDLTMETLLEEDEIRECDSAEALFVKIIDALKMRGCDPDADVKDKCLWDLETAAYSLAAEGYHPYVGGEDAFFVKGKWHTLFEDYRIYLTPEDLDEEIEYELVSEEEAKKIVEDGGCYADIYLLALSRLKELGWRG